MYLLRSVGIRCEGMYRSRERASGRGGVAKRLQLLVQIRQFLSSVSV